MLIDELQNSRNLAFSFSVAAQRNYQNASLQIGEDLFAYKLCYPSLTFCRVTKLPNLPYNKLLGLFSRSKILELDCT